VLSLRPTLLARAFRLLRHPLVRRARRLLGGSASGGQRGR